MRLRPTLHVSVPLSSCLSLPLKTYEPWYLAAYALFFLQSLFSPLQGMFNSVVYGFNKKVILAYSEHPILGKVRCVSRSCALMPPADLRLRNVTYSGSGACTMTTDTLRAKISNFRQIHLPTLKWTFRTDTKPTRFFFF